MDSVSVRQIVKTLSGNSFKVFYILLELSIKAKAKDKNHDGWIEISYNQLRLMTGVETISRVVDEFNLHPDIISMSMKRGVSNRYRISKNIVDGKINDFRG